MFELRRLMLNAAPENSESTGYHQQELIGHSHVLILMKECDQMAFITNYALYDLQIQTQTVILFIKDSSDFCLN